VRSDGAPPLTPFPFSFVDGALLVPTLKPLEVLLEPPPHAASTIARVAKQAPRRERVEGMCPEYGRETSAAIGLSGSRE
jgi:hypothetical protein